MYRTTQLALSAGLAITVLVAASLIGVADSAAANQCSTNSPAGSSQSVLTPAQTMAAHLGTAGQYSALAAAAITAPASNFNAANVGAGAAFTTDANTTFTNKAVQDAAGVSKALAQLQDGYAALRALPGAPIPGDLGGQVFLPGVYHSDAALTDSGTVVFDAQNCKDAVFVIQSNAAINTTAGTHMVLLNGAQASNVYWVSDAATTLGAGSVFAGTIVSNAAITVGAGSTVNGRLLSLSAAITLDADVVDSSPAAGQSGSTP